jgi:CRISPR/Cas system CSM-associated protein Csm3 (group 7 of RAMP superfamily)
MTDATREDPDQVLYPRIRITGRLTCLSPLHVGDGAPPQHWVERWRGDDAYPAGREPLDLKHCKDAPATPSDGAHPAAAPGEQPCTYHGVCRGYGATADDPGLPYIPGSTLRGGLRRLLDTPDLQRPDAPPSDPLVQRLFGYVQPPERGGGRAGRLRCFDAPLAAVSADFPPADPPPFWSARRATGIRHGIRLDDRLGTVKPGLLYSHELIPAGSSFAVELLGERLTHAELLQLLGLLWRWNGGLAAAIGGKAGKGWGRVEWQLPRVEAVTAAALCAWLGGTATELPFAELADLAPTPPAADPLPRVHRIRLHAEGPILVNEPGYRKAKLTEQQKRAGAAVPPTHEHSRLPDGTPILPGRSLLGVLRARARRIVASIAHLQQHRAPAAALAIADALIPRLFGAEGRRGALWLADAECDGSNREHVQHFNAIDRFTGGVKGRHGEGALFAVHACTDDAYDGQLLLETRRLEHQERQLSQHPDWWRGLLWLLLRDGAAGALRVGWGKAKGYGAFRLAGDTPVGSIADGAPAADAQALAGWLQALHAEILKLGGAPAAAAPATETQAAAGAPPRASVPGAADMPADLCNPDKQADFYLPYQFLPATGQVNGEPVATLPWGQVKEDEAAAPAAPVATARHDLWLRGTLSGRLHCRLTLVTDTFVGARQRIVTDPETGEPDPAKLVEPYLRHGERAIPGNSLRGVIGSVTEAISQSALRVLEDRPLSVRKQVKVGARLGPLSAIGRVHVDAGNYYIEPLTLPALQRRNGRYALPEPWDEVFAGATWQRALPGYLNRYQTNPHAYAPNSFLRREQQRLVSGGADAAKPWYAPTPLPVGLAVTQALPAHTAGLRISQRGYALIGQQLLREPSLAEQPGDLAGMLRVLGIAGREGNLPPTKKHELWLPEPDSGRRRLHVPESVLATFSALLTEIAVEDRAKSRRERRPYFPKGYEHAYPVAQARSLSADPRSWRPEPGMLLYFDIERRNGELLVRELSLSAVWRAFLRKTTHELFAAIDAEHLLPWCPERHALTPAEALFGVVEDGTQEAAARCLASRVRFNDALPRFAAEGARIATHGTPESPETLRILASPKPPSPALYFHAAGKPGAWIKKQDLGTAPDHRPNGRKLYLHHPKAQTDKRWWRSRDAANPQTREQKLRIQTMQPADGQEFRFTVDFDNLSVAELTLLRLAIDPADGFLHHLGLGKPLGLGSVRIALQAIECIDPARRYGTDPGDDGRTWHCADPDRPPVALPHGHGPGLPPHAHWQPFSALPDDPRLVDDTTLRQLLRLGQPADGAWVHHPLNQNQPILHQGEVQPNAEQKTYEWFVANEKTGEKQGPEHAQALGPLQPDGPLPTLRKYPSKNG